MNPKYFILGLFLFFFTIILPTWIIFPMALIIINNNLHLPIFYHPLMQLMSFFVAGTGLYLIIRTFSCFSSQGQGTPAPILPPKKIVTKGYYRQSRNPMYLGYLLIFLGMFLFFGHFLLLAYFLATFVVLHLYVVYFEEPILKKKFGKNYQKYLKKTPRWI